MGSEVRADAVADEDWVSPAGAAKRLKVSKSLVYKLASLKRIPSYRVGSSLRFNMKEVTEALRARERAKSNDPDAA